MKSKSMPYLSSRLAVFVSCLVLAYVLLLASCTYYFLKEGQGGVIVLFGYLCLAVALYMGYLKIYRPYQENLRILQLFSDGYLLLDAFLLPYPFCREYQESARRLAEIIKTDELISVSKKQAEYLALQNQINPHFLYNTLEGIRSEAILAGMDQVAEMTEALATFFRYTISHVDHLVTLEDELANIENYYIIQQFRFGEKLNLKIEFDQGQNRLDQDEDEMEVLKYQLPKLTLQPIVENSIHHGIEQKVGKGTLRIKIQTTADRLIVTVSDDGMGMEQDKLIRLNRKLGAMNLEDVAPEADKKGGIAMLNVNNRIKLLFGEEYGISIYSTQSVGTDVEVTLPKIRE